MFILKIKAETEEVKARYDGHDKAYAHDSGYDLFVPEEIICNPREVTFINHQVCMEMVVRSKGSSPMDENGKREDAYYDLVNVSYFIIPRSSISKTPLIMANSIGLIDAGYRGFIKSPVYNTSEEPYAIYSGTRLFQVILPTLEHFDVEFVNSLSQTERGDKGFGSSS